MSEFQLGMACPISLIYNSPTWISKYTNIDTQKKVHPSFQFSKWCRDNIKYSVYNHLRKKRSKWIFAFFCLKKYFNDHQNQCLYSECLYSLSQSFVLASFRKRKKFVDITAERRQAVFPTTLTKSILDSHDIQFTELSYLPAFIRFQSSGQDWTWEA